MSSRVCGCLWGAHVTTHRPLRHVNHQISTSSHFWLLSLLCAVLYEIYRPDNKPLTLMLPVNTSVQDVMSATVEPGGDHILVKMNSTGGGDADFDWHDLCIDISFPVPVRIKHSDLLALVIQYFPLLFCQFIMLKVCFWCINCTQKELSWSWMPLQSTQPWESMRDSSSAQAAKWNNWWVMGSSPYLFLKIMEEMSSLQTYFHYYYVLWCIQMSLVV